MCHERWMRRRDAADESQSIWQDFERTRPVAESESPPDAAIPEPTELKEEAAVSER
jgi:hypothetical protein